MPQPPSRKLLLYGLAVCLLQFIVFKLLYLFPDFSNSSYWYIYAASHRLDISILPIGYSKFLFVFHLLTSSDTALVAFQYFLFQASALHFIFTLSYFFEIKPWVQKALFWFIIVNPLTLYLANAIDSDTVLGALTLLWLSDIFWILVRPRRHHLIISALLLFLCFTLRSTTGYYFAITVAAIILSKRSVWEKVAGIILPLIFILPFVWHTANAAYKLTGTRTFSLLTGWQLANNVLYYYEHIRVDSTELPTEEARGINRLAIKFLEQISPMQYAQFLSSTDGNAFIINDRSPLKQYFVMLQKKYPTADLVKQWGMASVAFEPFGRSIALGHPWAYFRHFVLANSGNYFLPGFSDLRTYNNDRDWIESPIAKWFQYESHRIYCVSNRLQGFLFVFQLFFSVLHFYFLGVAAFTLTKIRQSRPRRRTVLLYGPLMAYLLINAVLSASVTINLLRYQIIPMFILLLVDLLLTQNILTLYAEDREPGPGPRIPIAPAPDIFVFHEN